MYLLIPRDSMFALFLIHCTRYHKLLNKIKQLMLLVIYIYIVINNRKQNLCTMITNSTYEISFVFFDKILCWPSKDRGVYYYFSFCYYLVWEKKKYDRIKWDSIQLFFFLKLNIESMFFQHHQDVSPLFVRHFLLMKQLKLSEFKIHSSLLYFASYNSSYLLILHCKIFIEMLNSSHC